MGVVLVRLTFEFVFVCAFLYFPGRVWFPFSSVLLCFFSSIVLRVTSLVSRLWRHFVCRFGTNRVCVCVCFWVVCFVTQWTETNSSWWPLNLFTACLTLARGRLSGNHCWTLNFTLCKHQHFYTHTHTHAVHIHVNTASHNIPSVCASLIETSCLQTWTTLSSQENRRLTAKSKKHTKRERYL